MNQNTDLAKQWFQKVWNERCEKTIADLMAPNIVANMPSGQIKSIDEFKQFRGALLQSIPDTHVEIENAIAQGDEVVVRWRVTGTHSGPGFAGLDGSGEAVNFYGMSWLRFENGKLVEGWDSWDCGGLINQLQAALTAKKAEAAAK